MNTINQALLARLKQSREKLLDADGRVRIDLACRSCGYNLRGAAGDGGCPECGTPVEDALQDDRPEHSSPRWLYRVALGGNLFGLAVLTAIAVLLLLIVAAIFADTRPHRGIQQLMTGLLFALVAVDLGLALAGVWLLTSRDTTRHHHRYEHRCRWAARLGLTAFLPVGILLQQVMPPLFQILPAPNPVFTYLALAIPLTLFSVGLIALMLYLQTLATRATDWNLVQSITTVCYGIGACSAIFLIGGLMAPTLGPPALACGCCNAFFAAALGVWAVLLIECTRQNLNAAKQRVKWKREAEAAAER